MKAAVGLTAILLLSVTAGADIRFFVTSSANPYGLNEPQNHNIATFSTVDADGYNTNAYDFYHSNLGGAPNGNGFSVSNFPPQDQTSGTASSPVLIQPDEWAYIWLQFDNIANGSKIRDIKITINDVTQGVLAPAAAVGPTYYYQNDKMNVVSQYRWDGAVTQPGQPEFHQNPQLLIGLLSRSIAALRADVPWNVYHYQSKFGSSTTGVCLLGALDPQTRTDHVYEITLKNPITDCTFFVPVPGLGVTPGYVQFVPEPAGILVVGLASLILRRR